MKNTELRLGNYLHDTEKRLCRVHSLSIEEDNEIYAPAIVGGITSLPNEPIDLTEEWLSKFGFEKYTSGDEEFDWDSGYVEYYEHPSDFGKLTICNWGDGFINSTKAFNDVRTPIEYVHQLQNLWFARTQKELELS